jgi:hypothetical protein
MSTVSSAMPILTMPIDYDVICLLNYPSTSGEEASSLIFASQVMMTLQYCFIVLQARI